MAFYHKDLKIQKAEELTDKLNSRLHLTHEQDLLLYYIQYLEKRQRELDTKVREYQVFFRSLHRLLPNENIN